METNKILSADWLDLLFDERNKAYGAYDLRKTYHRRITKALLITAGIAAIVFTGAVLANSLQPKEIGKFDIMQVELTAIPKDEPKPLPEPEKKPKDIQVRTEKLTTPVLAVDVTEPPPTQEDLVGARIDVAKHDGPEDTGLADVKNLDDGKGIVEGPKNDEP
jgi:protein TonB